MRFVSVCFFSPSYSYSRYGFRCSSNAFTSPAQRCDISLDWHPDPIISRTHPTPARRLKCPFFMKNRSPMPRAFQASMTYSRFILSSQIASRGLSRKSVPKHFSPRYRGFFAPGMLSGTKVKGYPFISGCPYTSNGNCVPRPAVTTVPSK